MTPTKKNRSKKYYKEIVAEHQLMLAKMRVLIFHVIDEISAQVLQLENSAATAGENTKNNTANTAQMRWW